MVSWVHFECTIHIEIYVIEVMYICGSEAKRRHIQRCIRYFVLASHFNLYLKPPWLSLNGTKTHTDVHCTISHKHKKKISCTCFDPGKASIWSNLHMVFVEVVGICILLCFYQHLHIFQYLILQNYTHTCRFRCT